MGRKGGAAAGGSTKSSHLSCLHRPLGSSSRCSCSSERSPLADNNKRVLKFQRAKMPQPRMRMRPWLEKQINSSSIPGLKWLNKEEGLFQIPWKHAAKHGWELERDATLFRNWAIHTGKYKIGEIQPDPKTWKANFRCAMNSLPDIEEVKDKSISKGCSAVRVYKMLPQAVKSQKKEKKPKSSKIKNERKSAEDGKVEETTMATNSIQLPDDHGGYSCQSYQPEDTDSPSITLELSTCGINSPLTDWKDGMDIQLPDSTNDFYPLQVSPIASSSDATDEDEDKLIYQLLNFQDWHQTNVSGKGFLLNEASNQNICIDLCFQDQDAAIDTTCSETNQNDSQISLDFCMLESPRLNNLHPISCGM